MCFTISNMADSGTSGAILQYSFQEIMDFCQKHYALLTTAVISGVGLLALRRHFAGGVCYSTTRLDGKTVIITGGNTGIGRETARDLARRGAKVILACRDITKAERTAAEIRKDTGNSEVAVKLVDLSSLESVRKFCSNLKVEKLDILINNAGIMACPKWQSAEGFELQFAVNHLGHFLLTNLLMAQLKAAAPSRIVNLSSLAHEKGQIKFDDINMDRDYNPWVAYGQSKLANVLFTRSLHRKLSDLGVSTYAVHPGVVTSELGRYLPLMETPPWYSQLWWKFLSVTALKNTTQGAQTSIYCAVQTGIEEHSGEYFSDCRVKEPAPQAKDDDVAERLWKLSCEMTGFKN